MTKKDYEAIAGIIRNRQQGQPIPDLLAKYFADENPRFDRDRFLAACRGEDSKDSAGRAVRYSSYRDSSGKRIPYTRGNA